MRRIFLLVIFMTSNFLLVIAQNEETSQKDEVLSDYKNPIAERRADPWVLKADDGTYYFIATVPEYDRIIMRKAKTINGLTDAEEKVIWTKHEKGVMGAHIWAPELHYIDGKWYVYFAI